MLCCTEAEALETEHETHSWLFFSGYIGSYSTVAWSRVAHAWWGVEEPLMDHGAVMGQEKVGGRCYEGGMAKSPCFNSQLKTLWPERFGKPQRNVFQ